MPDALICPKCSAEVQYRDAVGRSLECPHCHTPLVPERSSSASGANAIPAEFRPMVERALQMAQAAGRVGPLNTIEAIRFYRQASGVGLADAKRVIDAVGPLHVGPSNIGASGAGAMQGSRPSGGGVKSASWLILLLMVAIGCAMVGGMVAMMQSHNSANRPDDPTPITVPPMPSIPQALLPPTAPEFATLKLEFGSKGVGPGHFDDARSIAVDNQGHIYVGEYSNGRVQMFDTSGKYLSEFSLGSGNYMQNLIADRSGTVYVVSSSNIMRFAGNNRDTSTEMDRKSDEPLPFDYSDASLAPDGAMFALSDRAGEETEIVKLDTTSGHIISYLDSKKAVGESLDLFRIVTLATGEIYALDREKGVFKFSADGRYVNRFGGGKSAGVSPLEMPPSQLFSPQNIAADSQGRIYVSDAGSCIKVYDKEGNYLSKFGGNEVCFGIAIDDQDNIYACLRNRHTVRKYVLAKH